MHSKVMAGSSRRTGRGRGRPLGPPVLVWVPWCPPSLNAVLGAGLGERIRSKRKAKEAWVVAALGQAISGDSRLRSLLTSGGAGMTTTSSAV